ncbi:MAG: transcription elongation factor GreA [Gammaproteobacteria bacterium]|nr:transcription elongation factor GreA [Gammaproteobacteria bacterium]MCY4278805.1 transcription elongation factor GreA [Gammaproteobacteria bacterium]
MSTPMTVEGEQALREELQRLKFALRPKIIEDLAKARAHGDLRENAEYHAVREQHGFNEGRIQEIEGKLADAQVIDIARIRESGKVVFGATVSLENLDSGESVRYQIVGEDEADIKLGKISFSSPIGRALIGKRCDDEVEVNAPGGTVSYEILKVEHL